MSATEIVSDALKRRLAKQLMVAVEDVDVLKPVSGYGVDSLTAVDIRAWSLKDAQADISVLDIVNNASILSLAHTIAKNSRLTVGKNLEDVENKRYRPSLTYITSTILKVHSLSECSFK